MTHTFRIRPLVPRKQSYSFPKSRAGARPALIAATSGILVIVVLLAWIVIQICGSTNVIRSVAGELPRNTMDMHGTYGNVHVLPPARG